MERRERREQQEKTHKPKARADKSNAAVPTSTTNDVVVDFPSPGPVKMSDVLSHMAEGLYEDFYAPPTNLRNAIETTIEVWNLLVTSKCPRTDGMRRFMENYEYEDSEFARDVYDLLAERKQRLYPHLRNHVIAVEFDEEDDDGSIYFEVLHVFPMKSSLANVI